MGNTILNLIQTNQNVDYSFIIPLVIGYVVLFWVIVSVWVYFDATKRFKGKKMPIWIAIGNFVFQLPFLLLYLLFRPIDEEFAEMGGQGGVNVPIVNFIGKDGIAMSLELKINHNVLMPENASEMKIDVSFNSQDTNKTLVQPTIEGEKTPSQKTKNISDSLKAFWTSIKAKFPQREPKKPEDNDKKKKAAKKKEKKEDKIVEIIDEKKI